MAVTSYGVYIDWNGDGDFSDTGENVTDDVINNRVPLSIRYGRDIARALGTVAVGNAAFEINNASKDYSPDNASSPLYPNILPGRDVKVEAVHLGNTYVVLRGKTDDYEVKPQAQDRSVAVTVMDGLGLFKDVDISTGVHQGLRSGDAIGVVLDAIGWPTALRDIDPGASVFPYWWLDGKEAFAALQDIVDSEGPPSLFYVDYDTGNFVYRDRHHRLLNAASLTSQSTWQGDSEPIISTPMRYNNAHKEIVNSIEWRIPIRSVSGEITDVWTTEGNISISSGETVLIMATATSAFVSAIVPQAGVDYTLLSGTVSMTLTRTHGQSIGVRIMASGGPAVVQNLKLRGSLLDTVTNVVVKGEDSVSINDKYGRQTGANLRAPVWANRHDALAILEIILGKRADRLPTISVTMEGRSDTNLTQQLTRKLSDRITLIESETGINSDCFIEQISHVVSAGRTLITTTFGLEKVPTQIDDVFTFDVTGLGFNDGVFANVGQDNPDTIFILDGGAGHRFDEGVFAN